MGKRGRRYFRSVVSMAWIVGQAVSQVKRKGRRVVSQFGFVVYLVDGLMCFLDSASAFLSISSTSASLFLMSSGRKYVFGFRPTRTRTVFSGRSGWGAWLLAFTFRALSSSIRMLECNLESINVLRQPSWVECYSNVVKPLVWHISVPEDVPPRDLCHNRQLPC